MFNEPYDGKDDLSSMFQIDTFDDAAIPQNTGYFIFDGAKYAESLKYYYSDEEEHTRTMIEDDDILELPVMKKVLDELQVPAIREAIYQQPVFNAQTEQLGFNYLRDLYSTVFNELYYKKASSLLNNEFEEEFEDLKLKKAREAARTATQEM